MTHRDDLAEATGGRVARSPRRLEQLRRRQVSIDSAVRIVESLARTIDGRAQLGRYFAAIRGANTSPAIRRVGATAAGAAYEAQRLIRLAAGARGRRPTDQS